MVKKENRAEEGKRRKSERNERGSSVFVFLFLHFLSSFLLTVCGVSRGRGVSAGRTVTRAFRLIFRKS
jgi:hypothetical protein